MPHIAKVSRNVSASGALADQCAKEEITASKNVVQRKTTNAQKMARGRVLRKTPENRWPAINTVESNAKERLKTQKTPFACVMKAGKAAHAKKHQQVTVFFN